MTTVEFHVLKQEKNLKSLRSVCEIVETAYKNANKIFILADTRHDADQIDSLLWTYKDISFLPHEIASLESNSAIQIGFDESQSKFNDVLINLTQKIPEKFEQFLKIIEIVFAEPVMQQLARERFKHYRQLGCEIKTTNNR